MTSATAATMIARVRDMADDGGKSQFNTDAQILNWLNDGMEEFHNLVVGSFQDYVRLKKTYDFDGRSPGEYVLPGDMLKPLGMDWVVSTTERRRMQRFANTERNTRQTGSATAAPSFYGVPQYRIVGNVVEVIPAPSSGTEAELFYVPEYKRMVELNDVPMGYVREGWEVYGILHAAMECILREEGDIRPLMAKKDAKKADVVSFLTPRDAGEPMAITDTQSISEREWLWGGW